MKQFTFNIKNYSGKVLIHQTVNSRIEDMSKWKTLLFRLVQISTIKEQVYQIEPNIQDTSPSTSFTFWYNDFIEAKNAWQQNPNANTERNLMFWSCIYEAMQYTDIEMSFVDDNNNPVRNNSEVFAYVNHLFAMIELDKRMPLNQTIGWRTKLKFGKYSQWTYRQLLDEHPDYLEWLHDKADSNSTMVYFAHQFCVEHSDEISAAIEKEEHRKAAWKAYYSK